MQRKIDFMIIGTQKAGSSSLHYYLSQHPDIYLPPLKDVQFFERDEYYRELDDVLKAIYKGVNDEKLIGGSDVNLLYFYHTAERLYKYNPNMKLIAILRNPIDRAYSAYWAAVRDGFESCKTFEEAISLEMDRRKGSLRERGILTYLEHGHYDEQLGYYYTVFPKEQIYVMLLEDLKDNPEQTIKDLLTWLGVKPDLTNISLSKKSNVSSLSKVPWLQKLFTKETFLSKTYRKLPPSLRILIYERIYLTFREINSKPYKYPPMSIKTRKKLINYYEPHIKRLSNMLNRDLTHWLEL